MAARKVIGEWTSAKLSEWIRTNVLTDTSAYPRSVRNEFVTTQLEPRHVVGTPGEPAYANGWGTLAGSFPAAFWKDSLGNVFLEGHIAGGTMGLTAFQLPAAYLHGKANNMHFPVASNSAYGEVFISSTGNVVPQVGSNVYITLNHIRYRVA